MALIFEQNFRIYKQLTSILQLSITNEGDSAAVGIVIVNTIIGGCSGGLVAMFITWFQTRKWSYLITLNGCLTGTHILHF